MDTQELFVECILIQQKKELEQNIWNKSKYKDIIKLKPNNIGIIGEAFVNNLCKKLNINAEINGSITKSKECGDGYINGKSVEIKTSTLGSNKRSFQHELGEHPYNSDFIIFIDISPECIYLTIFKNWNKDFYINNFLKCEPIFPSKSITRRKQTGSYKLDTTILINTLNVKSGLCIIVDNATDIQIKDYINNIINQY